MTTPNNQPTPPEGYRLSYEEPFTLFQGVKWLAMNGWFDIPECRIGCEAYHRTFYAIPITPTVPSTGDTKDAGQTPADALDSVIDDCVEAYEYLGEDESGRDCVYQPTEQEQILIKDAIRTIISDSDFEKAYERVMRDEGDTTNEKGGELCADTDQARAHSLTPCASNAALAVPSHEQRQELLPCPFCGPDYPRFSERAPGNSPWTEDYGYWKTGCAQCGIEFHGADQEEAEERWNTRK